MIDLMQQAPLPLVLLLGATFVLLIAVPPMLPAVARYTPQARRSYRRAFRVALVCISVLLMGSALALPL